MSSKTNNMTADNHTQAADSPDLATIAGVDRRHLIILLAVVFAITLGAGIYLYQILVLEEQQRDQQHLADNYAQNTALQIQKFLSAQNKLLAYYSQQSTIAAAAAAGNTSMLNLRRMAMQKEFTDAKDILFHQVGAAELRSSGSTPISYAELDLIRRAESGSIPLPEAIKPDEHWHLHYAAPLKNGESVVATIFIESGLDTIAQLISEGDAAMGQWQLVQQFDGSPAQPVFSHGASTTSVKGQHPIEGSFFKIVFTPSSLLLADASVNPMGMLTLTLALFGLLAGGGFMLLRERAKTYQPPVERTPVKVVSGKKGKKPGKADMTNPIYHSQDILDIDVIDEDQDLLGLDQARPTTASSQTAAAPGTLGGDSLELPDEIFRAYDIRGLHEKQITEQVAYKIGQAVGSEALDAGDKRIFVARDGRTHSPQLCAQLIDGITSTGCQVIDLGLVPTPVMYFAVNERDESNSGVIVTASHNSAEYNGFKIVINGHSLADDEIQALKSRILRDHMHHGGGSVSEMDVAGEYIERIFSDIALAGDFHLVIDAANGATSKIAPQLFEELGCEITPLYCEIDGNFPNHQPDPSQMQNLEDLIAKVKETGADGGIALDGDGDRVTIVTGSGEIILPDRMLMLLAKDIVSRNPGSDIIFDIKCTRQLNSLISGYGGRPIMWKSGHSHIKGKMDETGALLGGDLSGHIFIKDRWYGFDDGMYAAARLLEIISLRDQDLDSAFESFTTPPSTPEILIPVAEDKKFAIISQLIQQGDFPNAELITIDGLRAEFGNGWGLVRASNTTPAITLRFEADNESTLEHIKAVFKQEIAKVDSSLPLNF